MDGIAAWSSDAWLVEAVAWMDARLADAGRRRTGAVQQPHVRPWSTVLVAPMDDGRVWMKAGGPGTAFEAGLCALLAEIAREDVLRPLGVDAARGWMLLPDGGPALGEQLEGAARLEALQEALVRYGRLQRALAGRVEELLALGLADMRPAAMPARFHEALAAVEALGGRSGTVRRVAAAEDTVLGWCARLAAAPGGASLDHNDLHPFNVLADSSRRSGSPARWPRSRACSRGSGPRGPPWSRASPSGRTGRWRPRRRSRPSSTRRRRTRGSVR
jgi:hypothetical protein